MNDLTDVSSDISHLLLSWELAILFLFAARQHVLSCENSTALTACWLLRHLHNFLLNGHRPVPVVRNVLVQSSVEVCKKPSDFGLDRFNPFSVKMDQCIEFFQAPRFDIQHKA